MELFNYFSDSHAGWDCLSQLANIDKRFILGTPNNKPDLSQLGYSMEILTACRNGTIHKPSFKLLNYTSRIVYNDRLDEKSDIKKFLHLETTEDRSKVKDKEAGVVYENSLPVIENEQEELLNRITKEQIKQGLQSQSEAIRRRFGVDIRRLVDTAEQGYAESVKRLKAISEKDKVLGEQIRGLLLG